MRDAWFPIVIAKKRTNQTSTKENLISLRERFPFFLSSRRICCAKETPSRSPVAFQSGEQAGNNSTKPKVVCDLVLGCYHEIPSIEDAPALFRLNRISDDEHVIMSDQLAGGY